MNKKVVKGFLVFTDYFGNKIRNREANSIIIFLVLLPCITPLDSLLLQIIIIKLESYSLLITHFVRNLSNPKVTVYHM